MSVVGLNRLARELEHTPGLLGRYLESPGTVLDEYRLTESERRAVAGKDAAWLLDAGMNPVALRNLMVVLGIAHQDMYPAAKNGG
ncbi:aromatic-ring opening dioxygenase LigAB LigA subunit [Actinocorallia herbida]|uniref:Aromatic-ring opening dioxygenase LigAB LigA subunit n=1 Tax=Actinocorallia herbida TaxID=58109 RepID=A0A3N1CUM0_9ACTN|nr:hypothetical protein [Actinocorallia herbida]ROO85003.1 aromatic-ring opening dioxygenase LigAB LigA subunit [Actinocorallia herbida]